MTTQKYKIAQWFIIVNYVVIGFSFLFALFFVYITVTSLNSLISSSILMFLLAAVGFIAAGIYSIKILPRLRETIIITGDQISMEHVDGSITAISFKEDFKIINRPFLGRLDLVSQDGGRVIRLEQQLSGYEEILSVISCKLREKQNSAV